MEAFPSPCTRESQPLTCSRPALLAGTPTPPAPSFLISSVGVCNSSERLASSSPLAVVSIAGILRSHKLGVIWISQRDLNSNTTPFPHQKKNLVLSLTHLYFLTYIVPDKVSEGKNHSHYCCWFLRNVCSSNSKYWMDEWMYGWAARRTKGRMGGFDDSKRNQSGNNYPLCRLSFSTADK